MDGLRTNTFLMILCAANLVLGSGCRLFDKKPSAPVFPSVLQPGASLAQVIDAVHNNTQRIQSFSTNAAQLSGPGIPVTLRGASIAFERPRRLRIQAGTALTSELDVGSNDELFWFWVRQANPPAIYFCRHDQFASCEASRQLPIDPNWLIEAFGIVEFRPTEQHQGPIQRPDGRLEIYSVRQTPCGPATKKTVIDSATALVHEQNLYDYQGRVVASTVVREHRLDPLTNLVMPKVVDLQYPQAEFSMQVNLGNVTINQPAGNPSLWVMPANTGWPMVDLANPGWSRSTGGQAMLEPFPPTSSLSNTPPELRSGFNRLR